MVSRFCVVRKSGERSWCSSSFSLAFLKTFPNEMILASTLFALHDVSLSVSWVLLSTMSFARCVGSVSLAFTFEVGKSVFVRPEESFSFAFASLVELD